MGGIEFPIGVKQTSGEPMFMPPIWQFANDIVTVPYYCCAIDVKNDHTEREQKFSILYNDLTEMNAFTVNLYVVFGRDGRLACPH